MFENKSLIQPLFFRRTIAKIIDIFIILILMKLSEELGLMLSIAYALFCDGFHGASIGKKFTGLIVVDINSAKPATFVDSFFRNITVVLPFVFFLIPVLGWILFFTIGLFFIIFEIYLSAQSKSGLRIGDTLASTSVVKKDLPVGSLSN